MNVRNITVLTWLASIGCVASPTGNPNPCGHARVEVSVDDPMDTSEIDLVLVIDGSPAIQGFREHAAEQAERIVRVLASGDVDGDGLREFLPVHTLRVAVIDTDMGGGACGVGDGGAFRTAACASAPTGVVTHETREDPTAFLAAVGCLADSVGASGCAFERGMDAMLAARDPIRAAFSNESSILGFVVIAAEDDCSTEHPELLSGSMPASAICHDAAGSLRSVDEVASALIALRPSPMQIFFAVAAGLPPSLSLMDPTLALAAPEETVTPDPAMPGHFLPACTMGASAAEPARRWLSLAAALHDDFAAESIVSICADDFEPVLDVHDGLTPPSNPSGVCLPRALNPDAAGRVACDVFLALPWMGTTFEVEHCANLPSPDAFMFDHLERASTGTREICRVRAVVRAEAGATAGWAYDDGDPMLMPGWSDLPMGCAQRIGLSAIAFRPGDELRVSCDEDILPSTHAAAQRGTFCDPATTTPIDCSSAALVCDPFLRSCQTACTSDADCSGGLSCDRRDAETFFDGSVPDGIAWSAIHSVCFDSRCEP